MPQALLLNKFNIALRWPELYAFFEEHPEVFFNSENSDFDYIMLVVYILAEKMKGETSFWKPYLDVIWATTELPFVWTKDEL